MTDKELAQLQLGIYGHVPVTWDFFTGQYVDVVWGAKKTEFSTVIVLRGSVTLPDWLDDFTAIADPFAHDGLGPVHPGFYKGMDGVWQQIKSSTSGQRIVVGHSLGAARAAILTGLMVLDGQPPIYRCVWGEPKSTFAQGAVIIGKVLAKSYRNGDMRVHDPVTDVPLSFPPMEYQRASVITDISVTPTDDWHGLSPKVVLAWHNMKLYAEGSEG